MDKYSALLRAQLHLDFIHANSTTHSFLFGALAELLDNARDSGAGRIDVFSVDNEKLQGGFMLCFLDDGCGMSPGMGEVLTARPEARIRLLTALKNLPITEEAADIIYFGTCKKRLSTFKLIGQYGNGLKSGSMRIGKDFILFTKKEETMTCLFFSQTFCEREGLTEVVVPIPSWLTRTRESVTDDPQKFSTELSVIYKYSPFKNEAELMDQFDVIYGRCGTLLVVYNLKLLLSGEPELDIKTDREDILIAGAMEELPEKWSLRAYTAVLYFDPRMRIFIQAKRVQTKHLCYSLFKPRKYQHVTSSFKGKLKNEITKAEEALKTAELLFKAAQIKVNQPDRVSLSSAKDGLQKALEDVEAKRKNLREKQRELQKARTVSLFFGVNIEHRSQTGMFIYSSNRLIKMHEKVGPQLKAKSLLGAGVIGIVNIPLEIMKPSHNKQEFLNVREYNHLLKVMGQYLVQYCKDTGTSNRNMTLFWDEIRYQQSKEVEKDLESIYYQRRQAMAIPFIRQCDLCLKWRVLPSSSNYQEKESLDMWICANNPNHLENSCNQIECLPSIPLGTMCRTSSSKNEKDKRLQESVQRYQNRLADLTSQENSQIQRIRLSGDGSMQGSLSSFELPTNHNSQKRNTEDSDSDVEFVSVIKTGKRSLRKKLKHQLQRHKAARPGNLRLTETAQISSLEMKRRQRVHLVQESEVLTEVESNNKDPDVILVRQTSPMNGTVWGKSSTNVLLKQEQEIPLITKEKQELYSDTQVKKRSSSVLPEKSLPNVQMEDLSPGSGHKASSVSGDCQVPSSLMSSQSTSITETAGKLMSKIREILLYFLPEFQQSPEFECTAVEDLIASLKLEGCPEQTNEKLRTCWNQIQNIFMVQYEKKMKRKMQAIICEANRRGILNEVFLGQCEQKRKIVEDKLNNLRTKLVVVLQKLQLDGPVGDLEQIDAYLEALLKEDNLQTTLKERALNTGHCSPFVEQ